MRDALPTALLLALAACAPAAERSASAAPTSAPAPAAEPAVVAACAECRAARLENLWCEACGLGYVAGFPIRSRMLFEALDAHGHDLDLASIECEACTRLAGTGGFCDACRMGWIAGQAYFSRITYHLGLGTSCAPDSLECAPCRELVGGEGWCEGCGSGWAGNVRFRDRADHAAAVAQLPRLRSAIDASTRCQTCALVLLVDGRCPYCRIEYAEGRAVQAEGTPSASRGAHGTGDEAPR